MWPFKKKRQFYVNNHPCDDVQHAFQFFEKVIVVMRSGDCYIIKNNWVSEDYEVTLARTIDCRHI